MARLRRQPFVITALLSGIALVSASCGEVARTGQAPVILVINSLQAASGATPEEFGTLLYSDVQTLVEQTINSQTVRVPTIFSDLGQVSFRLTLKNPGSVASPLAPSTLNEVTVTRYRVRYLRSDGRNTPGVDVPWGFDGGMTVTVPANGDAEGAFEVVRHSAKSEPPLRNLINSGQASFILTIAEVTFFGRDQAGNEVMATGMMTVNFGDWGDPD
jgi:hypothetical protein